MADYTTRITDPGLSPGVSVPVLPAYVEDGPVVFSDTWGGFTFEAVASGANVKGFRSRWRWTNPTTLEEQLPEVELPPVPEGWFIFENLFLTIVNPDLTDAYPTIAGFTINGVPDGVDFNVYSVTPMDSEGTNWYLICNTNTLPEGLYDITVTLTVLPGGTSHAGAMGYAAFAASPLELTAVNWALTGDDEELPGTCPSVLSALESDSVPITDVPLPTTTGPVHVSNEVVFMSVAAIDPTSTVTAFAGRFTWTNPEAHPGDGESLPPGHYFLRSVIGVVALAPGPLPTETLPLNATAIMTEWYAPDGVTLDLFQYEVVPGSGLYEWFVTCDVSEAPPGEYSASIYMTLTTPTVGAQMGVFVGGPVATPPPGVTIYGWLVFCSDPVTPPAITFPNTRVCIGSGTYSIDIVRRPTALGNGGPFLPGEELELLAGNWKRQFGTSTAGVTIAADATCCESIEAMRDLAVLELEIWRADSRVGTNQLVWAGPITDLLDNRDGTFLITAADMSYYVTDERVARAATWVQADLATIFTQAVLAALGPDNPGITITATPTGILADRAVTTLDAKQLGSFLSEISTTGVDWTVVGREWRVGGQQVDRSSVLPIQLHDQHFATPPKIRISRSGMATRQLVRGNGVVGSYGGERDDGVLIEKIADENTIIDQGSADAAAKTRWDRVSEPVTAIDSTSEAQLDADTEVDIQTLVPGMGVPVDLGDCLTYQGLLRLQSVSVDFGDDEAVKITLQPVGTGALS